MKRSWFGFFLLILLLGLSLVSSWAMEEIHSEASEKLEQAADFALSENWHKAAFLTAEVLRDWDRWQLLRSALADHGPMEDIESSFAVLEVYARQREKLAFAASCRELSRRIEAMGDAHAFRLRNLL